jgi:hypothetical protein
MYNYSSRRVLGLLATENPKSYSLQQFAFLNQNVFGLLIFVGSVILASKSMLRNVELVGWVAKVC